jgi:hypothetical protein
LAARRTIPVPRRVIWATGIVLILGLIASNAATFSLGKAEGMRQAFSLIEAQNNVAAKTVARVRDEKLLCDAKGGIYDAYRNCQ